MNIWITLLCINALIVAVWTIITDKQNKRLKAENKRLRSAVEYANKVTDMYIRRDKEREEAERNKPRKPKLELRKGPEGKYFGYVDKE